MVQTILRLLAQQMRLLETKVEIRIADLRNKDRGVEDDTETEDDEKRSPTSGKKVRKGSPTKSKAAKEELEGKTAKSEGGETKDAKSGEKGQTKLEKEQAKAVKEQAKADKAVASAAKEQAKAAKEQAKADKAVASAEKEQAKAGKAVASAQKEQAKADKAAASAEKEQAKKAKDQTKSDKAAAKADKQKEKDEKMTRKEKEKEEKAQEKLRKKEQLDAGTQAKSRPSIEVVTRSQFALLQDTVDRLKLITGPLPMPSLPENQELLAELSRGSATLTDTMQAMQVTARVNAVEGAISRMTGMLTQLTAAGAIPPHLVELLEPATGAAVVAEEPEATEEEIPKAKLGRKSVMLDSTKEPKAGKMAGTGTRSSVAGTSRSSVVNLGVTHTELDDAIMILKQDLMKNVQALTNKAITSADFASSTTKAIGERLEKALGLDTRVTHLYALTSDYSDQLKGFDIGITTQMQGFQEQMAQMRSELKEGLVQLEMVNNNSETAAVTELTERYEDLAHDLDTTHTAHQQLENFQGQLSDELRSLVEVAEMMREQKADRDEVLDGLRDKAGMSQLQGLLREEDFLSVREELDLKLDDCYTKFRKQESVWQMAMRDLTELVDTKAGIMLLLSLKDEAQNALRNIDDKLALLFVKLGEPKAAILMRELSKDGKCGACNTEALMAPVEPTAGQPCPLPALHPAPPEPCVPHVQTSAWLPPHKDDKYHICNRWVGGSHTLLSRLTPRERAPQTVGPSTFTRRYLGVGADGRNYKMEEEMKPCAECIPCQEVEVGDTKPSEGDKEVKKKGSCHCSDDPVPSGIDGAGDLNTPDQATANT